MKKLIVFSFAILLTGAAAVAQGSQTSTAIIRMRSNDVAKAKEYIDEAYEIAMAKINNNEEIKEKDHSKFWYTRADIYFKISISENPEIAGLSDNATEVSLEALDYLWKYDVKDRYTKDGRNLYRYNVQQVTQKAFDAIDAEQWNVAMVNFEKTYELKQSQYYAGGGEIDTTSLYNAALMAQRAKDYNAGIRYNKMLTNYEYGEAEPFIFISYYFKQLENIDSARYYVNQGLEKYPSNKDLLIEKANFFINDEDYEGALGVLEDAIAADPDNAILYNVYGTILLQLSKFEEAEKPLLKATELDPELADAWYSLGTIQVERANAYVEKLNAKGLTNAEYEKLKKEQKGFYEAALPYFEKSLELNPEDLYTVSALKKVYYQLEMSDKMKEMMELEKQLTGE